MGCSGFWRGLKLWNEGIHEHKKLIVFGKRAPSVQTYNGNTFRRDLCGLSAHGDLTALRSWVQITSVCSIFPCIQGREKGRHRIAIAASCVVNSQGLILP